MEHLSQSLTQTMTYIKQCTSQLMATQGVVPNQVSMQRVTKIASIEAIELEHAAKQINGIQKELLRAMQALETNQVDVAHAALRNAMVQLNHENQHQTAFHYSPLDAQHALARDPALAG